MPASTVHIAMLLLVYKLLNGSGLLKFKENTAHIPKTF